MKKFLAMLMLLAMCFSCAAMAETTDEDLAAAKTYLFMMYKDLPETTMSDYEVVGVINIGGIEFPITWTADSDTIKIVPQDNKMVTIDVDEKNPEEVTYTLTATLSNAAGETVSVSFAHKVPAAMILEGMSYEEIVAAAYSLEAGLALEDTQRLYGTVTKIDTPWSDEYKQMFGGIGSNFMNPALTARAILFVSWSALMSSYPQSNFVVDATTSATPLGLLSKGVSGVNFMDLLLGNCGGVLGETCKLAILVGGIYLCVRKIADWRIPVSFIATVFVCYLIKDGAEMAIYQVFAGGLMLGAFFMATDYATSPVTVPGRVIMGIGCGLLLFIIRAYANYPEGCSFAILFMNVCTPLIDRFTAPHPFGEVKKHG